MAVGETELRRVLRSVLDRWDAADKAAWQAQASGQQDPEALAARQAAEAECWALQAELADLLLMLLRCATENKETAEGLRKSLMGLLAPDLGRVLGELLTEREKRHGKQR